MHLRDHPLMSYLKRRSWPPLYWRSVSGQQNATLTGEIGILKEVRMTAPPERIAKLYLLIEVEKRLYMGVALIGDVAFGLQVYGLLEKHLDEPIASIGDLDADYLL